MMIRLALMMALCIPPAHASFKDDHPYLYKGALPLRLVGRGAYYTFDKACKLGRWGESRGVTSFFQLVGSAGNCATPFLVGLLK